MKPTPKKKERNDMTTTKLELTPELAAKIAEALQLPPEADRDDVILAIRALVCTSAEFDAALAARLGITRSEIKKCRSNGIDPIAYAEVARETNRA